MNTNTQAKRILCYGDSNTWGCVPGKDHRLRYSSQERWTGVLQQLLGNEYEIIEEGLNGRTTCLDDPKPGREDKNGLTYLIPCLKSQSPLEIVILSLGTNDMKERFRQSPQDIGNNIKTVINVIKDLNNYEAGDIPQIILLSPPLVEETNPLAADNYIGATMKSRQLGEIFQRIATEFKLNYLDISHLVSPSAIDGLHLEKESHHKIAEAIKNIIENRI
jgi:lysophospholipase L1-like esterase